MKKLRYIIVALTIFLAAACYEVNEEIVINKDGSGTFVTKMDMSALLGMIQSMAGEEDLQRNGLDKAIDTVISMKNILDSAKDATAEQKRLLGKGTVNLKMNFQENIFKTDVHFPFSSYEDLGAIMSGSGFAGLGDVMKKAMSNANEAPGAGETQGLEQINNAFDVVVKNGLLSKKLNRVKYDSIMQNPMIAEIKKMSATPFEIMYTTTIRLPRPVKKSNNTLIQLSADKKTVTMKYDLMKMLDKPEQFSYTIEF